MNHQEYLERRDEIVRSIAHDAYNDALADNGLPPENSTNGLTLTSDNEAIDQLILDVIGEDEDAGNSIEVQNPFTPYKLHRNQLRQQQRNVIKGE